MRFTTGMLLASANTLLLTMIARFEEDDIDEEWVKEWKDAARLWVEDYRESDRQQRK